MPDGRNPEPKPLRLAFVLVVVGCLLRLTGLEVHSFWYDEGITMHVALAPDVIEALRGDRHPPVSFWAFRAWARLGGESDGWLRLLPALLSCASLALFAGLARGLLDRRAATAAIALFALSPFHVWHGQEVRMYAFVECATLLALVGALGRQPVGSSLACLAGTALAVGSHYMGVLVVPAGIALITWRNWSAGIARRLMVPQVAALILGALVWVPWWVAVLPDQLATDWGNQLRASLRDLAELPIRLLLVELDVLSPSFDFVTYLSSAAILIALGVGAWAGLREPRGPNASAAILFIVPVLAALALAAVLPPNFTPKYLITASPGLALLVGSGAVAIRWRWLSWTVLGAALLGCSALVLLHRQGNHREDFRSACEEVVRTWRAGDRILVITGTPTGHSESTVRHYLKFDPAMESALTAWEPWQGAGPTPHRTHVIYRSAKYAEDRMQHVRDTTRVLEESPERFRVRWLLVEPAAAGDEARSQEP